MVANMPETVAECETEQTETVLPVEELIALGRRHMLLDEYSIACEHLAAACQQLATTHGDMGKECAPAYLLYGKCLLELARLNMRIVDPDTAKAKAEEGEEKQSKEPMEEIKECDETEEEKVAEEEPAKEDTKDEEDKEESNEEENEGEGEEEGDEEDEEGEGEEEEAEDDADCYLKLAWTVLDLAKVIYLREKTMENDFSASDCLMALGEVSMEGGNCDIGTKDMKEAIHLRRLHSGRVDRKVAGCEYELGAALHQFQRYEEATSSLKECLSILTELCEKAKDKVKATTDKEATEELQSEVNEFEEFIASVKEKITEVEEEASMHDKVKSQLEAQANQEQTDAEKPKEVNTLTARRKVTETTDTASPARSTKLTSLVSATENIDSPATKSRVAALISAQLKRHRIESPGGTESVPVKRPASSNSTENENGVAAPEEDEVSTKRVRADETAAN